MPKTVVGLFQHPNAVDDIVRKIEALGFPRNEIRTLEEPVAFKVTGVMSFPRLEFETALSRELARIGATKAQAQAYIVGLRRGGALVLATDQDEGKVDAAADIMNVNGAVEIEEAKGPEPHMPALTHGAAALHEGSVLAGRLRQSGGGACFFVW